MGIQDVTRGYREIQRAARGYRTGAYKELHAVTRGDRGFQGVTGSYKGL